MPVDLSYKGMFVGVFLCGSIVFAYLALTAYRVMAASLFPRLCNKRCYWVFCLMIVIVLPLSLALCHGRASLASFVDGVLAFMIMSVPCIVLGTVGIVLRWHWRVVLLSCVLEILLFPVWFFLVFMVLLFFDGSD